MDREDEVSDAALAALDDRTDEALELETTLTVLCVESAVVLEPLSVAPRVGGSHMEDEDRLEVVIEVGVEVVPGLGGLLLAATLLLEVREDCCDEEVSEEDACEGEDCCDEETTVEVAEETCNDEEAELSVRELGKYASLEESVYEVATLELPLEIVLEL